MLSLEQKLDKFLFIHFQIYRSVPIFVSLIQLQFILGKFRDIRKKMLMLNYFYKIAIK